MKQDVIEFDIEGTTSKTDSYLSKIISKFNALNKIATNVSNTMKKVGDSTSSVVGGLNNLTKSSDIAGKSIAKNLNIKPEMNLIDYENQLKQLEKKSSTLTKIIPTLEDLKRTHVRINPTTAESEYRNVNLTDNGKVFQTKNLEKYRAELNDTNNQIEKTKSVIEQLKKAMDKPISNISSNDLKKLKKNLKDTTPEITKLRKSMGLLGIFKGLFSNISTAFALFSKVMHKNTDGIYNKFKKLGLGLLGVRTAMSVLTKAVGAYLSFDSGLQDSVTNSWNMMGSLLAPAIEMVASLFATATNYVYQFMKALTGIDFVARANAKALKAQASATKAAGQAQRSLSSMDEITNLQTDAVGGGGGTNVPQIEVPEIKASDFISDLIAKIKAGDWYGAGAYIADKINKALKNIDVKAFTDKLKQGFINATDMFNGFVETLDWSLLGTKLSDLTVGITGAIRAGIENVHWDSLGKGISDFLNAIDWVGLADNIVSSITGVVGGIITIFNNIDFSTLLYNISQGLRKGIQDITKVIGEIDWKKLGSQITDIILSIDWLGLAADIVEYIAQGTKVLPNVVIGIISEIPQKIKDIDWNKAGEDIVKLLKNTLDASINSIFMPFRTVFESIFGDIGEFASNAFDKIKEVFSPIVDFFGSIFGTAITNIKISLDNLIQIFTTVINYISWLFQPVFDGIVEGAKVAWNGLKIAFSPFVNFFSSIINKTKNLLKDFGSSVGSVVGGAFKTVVNGALRAIETILNTPIRAINGLIKVINKVPGVNLTRLNTFNLPRLATGTNEIPKEGIYHLHEGEAVVPKKYNPATGGYDNGADNQQIIELLVSLNANMLALSEREMAVYMDSRKVAEGIYDDMQQVGKNKNMSGVMKRS